MFGPRDRGEGVGLGFLGRSIGSSVSVLRPIPGNEVFEVADAGVKGSWVDVFEVVETAGDVGVVAGAGDMAPDPASPGDENDKCATGVTGIGERGGGGRHPGGGLQPGGGGLQPSGGRIKTPGGGGGIGYDGKGGLNTIGPGPGAVRFVA